MSDTKKLLIVDDSGMSRLMIRNNVLKQRKGWITFESDNGEDALNMVQAVMPDYVTMDVNMPNMSGLVVAEKIVRQWPHIRVCLVTANTQDAVQNRAVELNIGFIGKPINAEGIQQAIQFFEGATSNA